MDRRRTVTPSTSVDLDRADAYGEVFADIYDRWYHDVSDPAATARFVLERRGPGPVLELGVGTGRLSAPLTRAGVEVVGIDASGPMLARCPDGAVTHRIRADMTALPLGDRRFGAILIAFNTLFNVATVAGQRSVLAECRRTLRPDGTLIIETIDATLLGHAPSDSVGLSHRLDNGLVVSATTVDPAAQTIVGRHLQIDDRGVVVRPWRLRWLRPGQLDALAAEVGLVRRERHPGWGPGEPEHPLNQVTVYVRA